MADSGLEVTEEQELQAILRTLSGSQLAFVSVRPFYGSDAEAAEAAHISKSTVYQWPNKADIARAVALSRLDGINVAREKLRRLSAEAVEQLGQDMKNARQPKDRIAAAQAILDRAGIVAVQQMKLDAKSVVTVPLDDAVSAIRKAEAEVKAARADDQDNADD